MSVNIEKSGTKTVVHIEGDFDLDKTEEVREVVSKAIDESELVHLNMSKVTYMDSSGVSVLIESNQKAEELSKGFVLESVSESVDSVLKMAKLDSFFKFSK